MSRIYSNDPLQSIPVLRVSWQGAWSPQSWQSGPGVILEGCVEGRSRFTIDTDVHKARYFILHTKVTKAHKRKYDSSGKEMEPNFSETGKIRTGFLNSSYKTEAKGQTDALSFAEVANLITNPELMRISDKANKEGCLPLWIGEEELGKIELEDSDTIRVKTKGNSPFIDTFAKLDAQSSSVQNYAGGEAVGGSWTDKVMAVKTSAQEDDQPLPGADNEGVEDDEWDD